MQLIVNDTTLKGVKYLTTDRFEDLRGEFGGVYDEKLYFSNGLTTKFVADQVSCSHKDVLRGIHGDTVTTKLVQCLHGTVYSVVVDCNPESPDFGKWESFILSDKNHKQLWVPPLYGLSYYAQTEPILFTYKFSGTFSDNQFTYRWDDPKFNIHWPGNNPIVSLRDKTALLCSERHNQKC
jgi:dTDP-4-dehydrorhamnose 3,5-epimerase